MPCEKRQRATPNLPVRTDFLHPCPARVACSVSSGFGSRPRCCRRLIPCASLAPGRTPTISVGPDPYHFIPSLRPKEDEKGFVRHKGGANSLFCEGHLKWHLPIQATYNEYPVGFTLCRLHLRRRTKRFAGFAPYLRNRVWSGQGDNAAHNRARGIAVAPPAYGLPHRLLIIV